MKKLAAYFVFVAFILALFPEVSFGASTPVTAKISSSNMPGYQKYSKDLMRSFSLNVPQYTNYKVKSYVVIKNGINKGELGKYEESSKTIEISAINGDLVDLTANGESHMYHAIWRDSSGKSWTTGTTGNTFKFTADPSTIKNGVSEYPGYFPQRDDNGTLITSDLRYTDGSAAAWSDKLSPPIIFTTPNGESVGNSYTIPSSVTITGAKAKQDGVTIDYYGKGQDGYGYIKAHKPLTSTYNLENIDYDADNSQAYPVQGRTYYIDSITLWAAQTYILDFEIEVTYEHIAGGGGTAIIRHVDQNGVAIPGMPDREESLVLNKPFSAQSAAAPSGYKYAGYTKTTTGVEPTKANISNPSSGEYPTIASYDGSFQTLYLYYVYDLDPNANVGRMHVRHMVRVGPSGTYTKTAENVIPVSPLPKSAEANADPSYGAIKGKSQSFTAYSDTIATGSSVTMTLTTALSDAYVSFFYEAAPTFTADFDIIPDEIEYKNSFTLHPKNFELAGCTYISHKWRIVRGSSEYISPVVTGMNTDTTYSFSSYPSVIGVGSHNVFMKIITNCGESEWIGPKELEVKGPTNNRPPQFQIAWVRPSEPLKPVYKALEGEVLNLVVIQDATVPTPIDPDGDTISFDGFDLSSDNWLKTVPSKGTIGWMSYNSITMDGLGLHNVTATMRDQFGAVATASTYINVVPPVPIPVIDGPTKVVEGRPLPSAFSANGSYSPIAGRFIDHVRDEWTNRKTVYTTPGKETIKLDVYDSLGLKSISPATHQLTVLEDMPPVVELKGARTVVRGVPVPYTVIASSPDGDKIVSTTVQLQYDYDNNGNFYGEYINNIALDANKKFDYQYARVGKYHYTVCATEDWGKKACIYIIVDAVNDSPTVSFDVSSKIIEPPLISVQQIKASDLVNTIAWRNSDGINQFKAKAWTANADGSLTSNSYNTGSYTNFRSLSNAWSFADGYNQAQGDNRGSFGLGDTYYADNAAVGYLSWKIIISRKDTDQIYFTRQGGSDWYNEQIYHVDLFNNRVVTSADRRSDNTDGFLYYTLDSFVNPAGQPYKMSWTPEYSNESGLNSNIFRHVYFPGKGFNFSIGSDGNGSFVEKRPWDNPATVQKVYGNCIVTLMCARDDVRWMSYFGNYVIQKENDGLYLVDVGNSYSQKISNFTSPSSNGGMQLGKDWALSMDERYLLTFVNDGSVTSAQWNVLDRVTGTNTVTSLWFWYGPYANHGYHGIFARYNDYILFYSGSILSAYKFETTLTPVWSATVPNASVSVTNDGKLYFSADNAIKTIDIRTGYVNTVAYVGMTASYIRQTAPDTIEFKNGAYGSTYWIKGSNVADTQPLGTQNQLIAYQSIDNIQLQYTMQLNDFNTDQIGSGFSYRMQSDQSYYSVEQTAKKLLMVKVRNGWREIIGSADFAVEDHAWNTYKIIVQDDRHRVYVNGVPMIDIRDGEYRWGSFGPFSTLPKTVFKGMSYADLNVTGTTSVFHNVAIVGDSNVQYNASYQDPENDPAVKEWTQWSYTKLRDPFLDAWDGRTGASALDGKSFLTPQIPFDKVGVYHVTYREVDDPNPSFFYPDNTFAAYRTLSNEYSAEVIVHRRPMAYFVVEAMWDGTVKWTDYSIDPDRYQSNSYYSTEPTGIDYYKTHGIMEKKFYYITPSGKMVLEKLVTPQETGMYEIGMAVRDEYGAWSTYYVVNLNIGVIGRNNTPPVPGFTTNYINTFRNVPITFNSYAYDIEDGGRENLNHEYYVRNLTVTNGSESIQSISRTSWVKTFNSMGTFNIRQVVEDSLGAPAQFETQVTIHNQLPRVNIVNPSSADQNYPTKFTTLRPTFNWTYTDWDLDQQTQYQLRIYRYGGVLQLDTNIRGGASTSFIPTNDLPEKVYLYAIVRSYDGYDWSDWSAPKFFYIETNQPPVPAFDWSPKPLWEGDRLQLINKSTDPDGDQLTSVWTIVTPSGQSITYSTDPVINNVKPGEYRVTLTVSDGQATGTMTSTIVALPLTIVADIRHTAAWKQVHDREGHETNDHPKDFYAGEYMVVSVRTTAGAPVRNVTVQLNAVGMDGTDLTNEWQLNSSGSSDRYGAEIVDARWASLQSGLPQGLYSLKFITEYGNGTVKTTEVPFRIVGSIYEEVGVHRRQ